MKRIKYNIDWSSAAIDADNDEIDMELSATEERKQRGEKIDYAGEIKVGIITKIDYRKVYCQVILSIVEIPEHLDVTIMMFNMK